MVHNYGKHCSNKDEKELPQTLWLNTEQRVILRSNVMFWVVLVEVTNPLQTLLI